MAVVAFGLALIAADAIFMVISGFIVLASLPGAVIATRQERQES